MCVRTFLENAMDESGTRLTYKSISDCTGICKTLISRYFTRQKDLTFYDQLKLIRCTVPDQVPDAIRLVMSEYQEAPKPINVRALLLYLVNERMFEELAQFGDNLLTSNREINVWYELIKLFARHKQNQIGGFELISATMAIDYDTPETQALRNLLYSFGNHRQHSYTFFFEVITTAERFAKEIKSGYVRECLMSSISEQLANAYLYQRADTRKARFYANTVLNNASTCEVTNINVEYTMGISYMFEDFSKALTHLTNCVKGLRMLGKSNRALLIEQDDIAFLYNYWQKESLLSSDDYDESQQAYYYFLKGDINKAKKAVENLPENPFNTFLKGLIYKEDSFLVASCMQYRLAGNELFANLPYSHVTKPELKNTLATKIA